MILLGLIPFAGPVVLFVFAVLGPDPAGQRFNSIRAWVSSTAPKSILKPEYVAGRRLLPVSWDSYGSTLSSLRRRGGRRST